MARFRSEQRKRSMTVWLVPIIFAIAIVIFVLMIQLLESGNTQRKKKSLLDALNRDITWCYASEGRYPESLEYIEKNYGLTYDKEKYYIDYRIQGSNLRPEVTIIEKEPSSDEYPILEKTSD